MTLIRWRWVVVLCLLAGCAPSFAAGKPNVIVILADDLGFGDVGVHGCKDIPTPHIDSIAKNGVRCTNGYASCPYCSPTRAGLLTGRYQQRFGHEYNEPDPPERPKFGLPAGEPTLVQRLKDSGYFTAAIGKWHLGVGPEHHPLKRGFDEFYGTLSSLSYFRPELVDSRVGPDPKTVKDSKFYTTDAYAERAVNIIRKNKDKPFFIYLAFNAVHTPMDATKKYLDRFPDIEDAKRRPYAAILSAMDDAIGTVLATVRELEMEERTLIFFLSDNGAENRMRTYPQNGPFKGFKCSTSEGGIHVPFMAQWKGRLPAGKVYEQPVISIDVLPTALAAAGVAMPTDRKYDGVDLLPFMEGKQTGAPHDNLYWRLGPQWAIRQGDWKLVVSTINLRVNPDEIKVTGAQLFNLADDPGEKKNLAAANPEKAAALKAAWEKWSAEMMAPLWVGRHKKTEDGE